MREHDALREARGARGVLHHDDAVVVEVGLRFRQRVFRDVLPQKHQFGHAVEAAVLLRPHVDEVLQARIVLGVQVAALLRERFRHQVADDLQVVHVAVGVDDAERLHVGLLEHVVQLVALVDGVHRDHDHADLRRGVHEREPVGDVARPHAQVVARAHADGQKPARQVVGALVEVAVRPAQRAVRVNHELVVGTCRHLVAEVRADGLLGVQRIVGRAGHGGGRGGSGFGGLRHAGHFFLVAQVRQGQRSGWPLSHRLA